MDDKWRDNYDSWKLATPPEYETNFDEEREYELLLDMEEEEIRAAITRSENLTIRQIRCIVEEELSKR
jgi:hypothetical protein